MTDQDDVAAPRHASGDGFGEVAPLLSDVLARVSELMAFDPRDWGQDRRDAWLYGLFCGWDCEMRFSDPEHNCNELDSDCGLNSAMLEIARRHMWTWADVARLRSYREVIRRAQQPLAEGKERSNHE